jgi:hypothetical protein
MMKKLCFHILDVIRLVKICKTFLRNVFKKQCYDFFFCETFFTNPLEKG